MKGSVDVQKAMPEYIIFHVLKDRVIMKGAAKKFIFLAAPFFSCQESVPSGACLPKSALRICNP